MTKEDFLFKTLVRSFDWTDFGMDRYMEKSVFIDGREYIKTGDYNPFKELYRTSSLEEFNNRVLNLLLLMIGECTDSFERLPLVENVEILRNILYSGVWVRYGKAKSVRIDGKEKTDGSI